MWWSRMQQPRTQAWESQKATERQAKGAVEEEQAQLPRCRLIAPANARNGAVSRQEVDFSIPSTRRASAVALFSVRRSIPAILSRLA